MQERRSYRSGLGMQQQAMVQLVVAGVLFVALCVGAALLYSVGLGHRSVRSVTPVLAAFMQAGKDGDVLDGHRMLSIEGMVRVSRDQLAQVYGRRELFEGYDHLRVTSFQIDEQLEAGAPETATAAAEVIYTNRDSAVLEATLELEPAGWRIRTFRLTGDDG